MMARKSQKQEKRGEKEDKSEKKEGKEKQSVAKTFRENTKKAFGGLFSGLVKIAGMLFKIFISNSCIAKPTLYIACIVPLTHKVPWSASKSLHLLNHAVLNSWFKAGPWDSSQSPLSTLTIFPD